MDLFNDANLPSPAPATFQVNEAYAAAYTQRKQQEELSRLQDKHGRSEGSSEDGTDYSTEDEEAELATPELDLAILKTLQKIRAKDPEIYKPDAAFYAPDTSVTQTIGKKGKDKVVRLKDVDRMALLGQLREPALSNKTPVEAEAALKAETVAAFHAAPDQSDSEDSEFLQLRPSEPHEEMDKVAYRQFLADQLGGEKQLLSLLRVQSNSVQKEDDRFLRDYILGRGWIDPESKKVPTQADILAQEGEEALLRSGPNAIAKAHTARPWKALEEVDDEADAEFEDRAEEFETKYNLRFEEAWVLPHPTSAMPLADSAWGVYSGGTDLVTHARTTDTSVRRTDRSRKDARQARRDRKALELAEKQAERARLKTLKKTAILAKLEQIKAVAGESVDVAALEQMDLEGEFDEARHEKDMALVFGKEWYAEDEDVDKPTWDDDVDISDLSPPAQKDEAEEEAYDPSQPVPKQKRKKGQKKGKGQAGKEIASGDLEADSGLDIDDQLKGAVAQDLDAYYNLDYEDMIGDLPTRFKYTEIQSTDLGLSTADILRLTDRELNSFMSVKKLAPYRQDSSDALKRSKRKKLKELKGALLKRKWGEALPTGQKSGEVNLQRYSQAQGKKRKAEEEGATGEEKRKRLGKRLGKKERQKMRLV